MKKRKKKNKNKRKKKTASGIGNAPILGTTTREPFQPVRLYYGIPGRAFVVQRLRSLACVVEDRGAGCWHWLYDGEAAGLTIGAGFEAVPKPMRPTVLAWIRFPRGGGMTVQASSAPRAVEAARFFGPICGPRVVLLRGRVVNRCFRADEGTPDELMDELDRNVTVIDPRETERRLEEELEGITTAEQLERGSLERIERRIARGDDVPEVEDFPLHPEEESEDYRDLEITLGLRAHRALEHARGNEVNLAQMILDRVQQSVGGGSSV